MTCGNAGNPIQVLLVYRSLSIKTYLGIVDACRYFTRAYELMIFHFLSSQANSLK